MSAQNKFSRILSLVLRATAMAMGIATAVAGGLQAASTQTTAVLLGIGLSALALDALDGGKEV